MALRELLLPWDAQPQEVAPPAIDLGPDALLWSAAHPQLLIGAANRLATSEGSPLVRPGPLGMARAWSRNASAGALFGTFQHVTGLEVTAAVVAAPVASANRKIAWSQRTSGSNAAQFVFGFNIDGSTSVSALSGGISLVSRNTSGSGGELGASSQFDGLPHAWVLANGANEGYIYRDGVAQTVSPNYRAFGTVWTSAQATAIGNIGDYTTDGAFVSDDPIYLVIVWPRVLPADQAQRLSADLARNLGPAFEPRRIHVPVAAGGGGSWSVSLTETASASDSLGAATTALVSLIESASAADIITAATIAAVALTEAASASDTQTASYSVTGSGSVTESASASDTLDAATTMLRALTETASADDQLAAATTMLRAISESASAVDTPAASYSGAGTATIEELTSATDALTAAATLLVTILEAGNADDALQAATTMVRAITEQATAIDTVAGALPGSTWDVSIEELAAAVDLITGYAAGGLTVSPLGLRLSTTARMPRLSTRTR